MHDVARYFSSNYQEARRRFNAAALEAGYTITHERYPLSGPDGSHTLFTDIARKGPSHANVFITTSGIHGIEGYAGSAIQTFCLENGFLPETPDLAIVHVHALNPYGFEYGRRVNENNVDLNRNFIDWAAPPPQDHPLNEEIQDILKSAPGRWQQKLRIAGFVLSHLPLKQSQAALTQGQYSDPEGLFYGGTKERGLEWSSRLWRRIIAEETAGSPHVVHIDFHTGLGPAGVGELIVPDHPSGDMFRRAKEYWGRITSSYAENAVSSLVRGDMSEAFRTATGQRTTVTTATLEFGTVSKLKVLEALIADNYAHHNLVDADQQAQIYQMMRDAFCPADLNWKHSVLARSGTVLIEARNSLP